MVKFFTRDEKKVLDSIRRNDTKVVDRATARIRKVKHQRTYYKCPNCGKFVKEDDGEKHKPDCYLTHCKRCGRFTGVRGKHVCRFSV